MKTYEEMAQSALARGNAMRKQRKKTNTILFGTLSAVAVCCLVILLVFGIGEKNPNPGPGPGPLNNGQISHLPPDYQDPTSDPEPDPPNQGQTSHLSPAYQIAIDNNGKSFQYISGAANPGASSGPDAAPPAFEFQYGYIHVVAKAIEEVGTYETLNAYGSTQTHSYRMFAMQVIDPLESGMETGSAGTFFYLLPAYYQQVDLTRYDALLISMTQLPKNFVLRGDGELIADNYIFADPQDCPELGNIIAFTDGVFDESLWQDMHWRYTYLGEAYLDRNDDSLLVSRGSTLEEALQRRQAQIEEWGQWAKCQTVKHYDFQTEAAQQVMDYVRPFENGIFVPQRSSYDYVLRRYINGCPTNERIWIDLEDETVTASDYRFEEADFENLPDLSTYIAGLDLTKIAPQHTDPSGKILISKSAVGWYEKTETGVYSIVRIAWRYFDEDNYYMEYYDETFILLDETGDHIISREDLIELIGENSNISNQEYGVGMEMPMC